MEINLLATPEQRAIIECTKPRQILVSGRRWGKTITARNKAIKIAFEKPDAEIVYLAPSYRRSLKEFKAVYKALKPWVIAHRKQPPPEITLFNGSVIYFYSFDNPDNIRGDPVDLVIADEAAYLDGDEFKKAVAPMVLDRGGIMLLCSTFKGTVNWFYEEYQHALTDPDSAAWLYTTPDGVIFQGDVGIKRLATFKRTQPAYVWDQECLCIATTHERQVFRFIEGVLTDDAAPTGPELGHRYLAGIDLGDVADHTAVVIMDALSGAVVYTHYFELGTRHENIAEQCALICQRWRAYPVVDATGGASGGHSDSFIRYYKKALGELKPFIWSPNSREQSKENVISEVALQIQNRELTIPKQFGLLIKELKGYEFEHTRDHVRFFCPPPMHDDFVSAFCMAVWAKKKGWGNTAGLPLRFGIG